MFERPNNFIITSISYEHLRQIPDQQERAVFRFFMHEGYRPIRGRGLWHIRIDLDDLEKVAADFSRFRELFPENISSPIIDQLQATLHSKSVSERIPVKRIEL